jgi:hypothetical protein
VTEFDNFSIFAEMKIDLTTPALLFPAISLLLVAHTNRFLALANIIRNLHRAYLERPNPIYLLEIKNLRKRIRLIRDMQTLGILSLIFCMVSMFFLFQGWYGMGETAFGVSMVCMFASLVYSLREIRLSGRALDLHLQDLEMGAEEGDHRTQN